MTTFKHTDTYITLISLNGTLITSLCHQSCLMCVRRYLKLHRSLCLCHWGCPAPPTTTTPLHLSLSPSPSSNIPHLCNSHFASLSSPLPIPPLSLWGVAVMKMKSRSLCHCLFPSLGCSSPFYSTPSVPRLSSLASPSPFHPISSREAQPGTVQTKC